MNQLIKQYCKRGIKSRIKQDCSPLQIYQHTSDYSYDGLSSTAISPLLSLTHFLSLPLLLLLSVLLVGCVPNNNQDQDSSKANNNSQSSQNNTAALQPPVLVNTVQPLQLQRGDVSQDERKESRDAKQVKEGLKNSYARLAAKRTDVCPKLLQTSVDNNVIKRSDDVMVGDYCDYFIYPIPKQQIQVKNNNDQIESLLVVPTVHNFANGSYQVQSAQKHVIRLKYNGANYKAENLRYDISVIIE